MKRAMQTPTTRQRGPRSHSFSIRSTTTLPKRDSRSSGCTSKPRRPQIRCDVRRCRTQHNPNNFSLVVMTRRVARTTHLHHARAVLSSGVAHPVGRGRYEKLNIHHEQSKHTPTSAVPAHLPTLRHATGRTRNGSVNRHVGNC